MVFEARQTIEVRGNEIGFTGSVPPGTFARYCEWARWSMFTHGELGDRVKFESGVVRAQHLELLEDLRFPATVRIESVIGRVGRTSLDIAHRIVRVEDERLVARARVTVVKLGKDGPAPIDPAVAAVVVKTEEPLALPFEEGATDFETLLPVRPSDQDQFRHVNQSRYVDFGDDVRWLAAMAGNPAGFEGPLGRASVDYVREVKAGAVLRAELRLGSSGSRSIRLVDAASGVVATKIVVAPRP